MAVRAWRRVQVERPSSSTSGGQLDVVGEGVRSVESAAAVAAVVVAGAVFLDVELFIIDSHAADEVQVRQLWVVSRVGLRRGVVLTVCHLCPAPRLWGDSVRRRELDATSLMRRVPREVPACPL